jgi:hypothetical protein
MAIYAINICLALKIKSLTDSFCSLPLDKYSIAFNFYYSPSANELYDFEVTLLDSFIPLSSNSSLTSASC